MKKLLNRRIAIVAVAVIATVAFFSFKSGDDRNFQIAKNLDIFNAIVKELDMFYVDTIDPNKTIREGIDNMLYTLDPYTEYFPAEDQSELELMIKGSFAFSALPAARNRQIFRKRKGILPLPYRERAATPKEAPLRRVMPSVCLSETPEQTLRQTANMYMTVRNSIRQQRRMT